MNDNNTPPVMHDVARHAGVSQKTVSRVINDAPYVREEVRDRVLKAIKELGYRPNVSARALVTKQTATLGAIMPATELFGPNAQLHAIERTAQELGYGLLVASVKEGDRDSLLAAIGRVLDSGAAGIVISGTALISTPIDDDLYGTPSIVFGEHVPEGSALGYVGINQASGTVQAIEHLLDLGHDTVHHITGPLTWSSARERLAAWEATLRRHGRRVPDPVPGDWSYQSGLDAASHLLQGQGVTAIFAANDEMAVGAMRAASRAGRRIPEDLSIVGFDDTPMAAYLPIALTTVHQDFPRSTRLAVEAVIDLINGTHEPTDLTIPTWLVVRESTGQPRARAVDTT